MTPGRARLARRLRAALLAALAVWIITLAAAFVNTALALAFLFTPALAVTFMAAVVGVDAVTAHADGSVRFFGEPRR